MAALIALACDIPRDPEHTLERARGATLLVGVSEAPPRVVRRGPDAAGIEPDLVLAFARAIDARVQWVWGAADDHMRALERFELHLAIGGFTNHSAWRSRVAFTRAYDTTRAGGREQLHVLAAPPGENATLSALERVLSGASRGER